MVRRRHAVRLGIPALIVTVLTVIALWRVGSPPQNVAVDPGTTEPRRTQPSVGPVTSIAEILTQNSIGRRASLEQVEIREVVSSRTFWFGPADAMPAFAVLDPDVRRESAVPLTPGARVTLIGIVRPSPPPDQAMRQWGLNDATARVVSERGTYLHVTEVRP